MFAAYCKKKGGGGGEGKAFPRRFVRFLCLWKNTESSHFCSRHLNPPGKLRLSTRSQRNLFICKLFGSLRVYPYSSIPRLRTVPGRLRRQQNIPAVFIFANERQNCSRSCRKTRKRFPLYVQKTTTDVDLSLTCK